MSPTLGFVKSGEIKGIRSLEQGEHDEFKKSIECLMRFSKSQQLFAILKMNYSDLERLLQQYGDEYSKNRALDWLRMEMMITNINRHILNYLSSMKTFLDHSETNLKRLHGHTSAQASNFQKICSDVYDTNFSYRFLYGLRNYAQHCGMPVGNMELNSRLVPETGGTEDSISINFDRDELLKNYDWKKLKQEIEALPPKIEIMHHIRQLMICLDSINAEIIRGLPDLRSSADMLKRLADETVGADGFPCILEFEKLDPEGNKLNVKIAWLPIHLIEAFRTK